MPNLIEAPQLRKQRKRLIVKEGISPDTFSLNDAALLLDATFANGHPSRQQYRDALTVLNQRPVLTSILSSVLVNPDLLQEVASRSFRHSLGMERINLLSTDRYQWRLHIWWGGKRQQAQEDPEDDHKHTYNFVSTEVAGATVHFISELSKSDSGVLRHHRQHTTEVAHSQPSVSELGKVRLLPVYSPQGIIITDRMPPYTMGSNTIHQLWANPDEPAITSNLRGPTVKDRADVYTRQTSDHPVPTTSPIDLSESLKRVLRILNPEVGKRVM